MDYVNKYKYGVYLDITEASQNRLFSVYSRWSSILRMVWPVGSRESRSKAVKTPLAVPRIATGGVAGAVNLARLARFLRM